jgi:hypothetical protein
MGTEKFIAFKEDGSAYRLKGRILRFLDNEPVSEADKTNIRSTLSVPASAEGLTPANNLSDLDSAATARTNLSVNSIDEDAQANALKTTAPALYFNGSSSYVTVADDDRFSFTDGTDDLPFSISAWIKPSSAGDGTTRGLLAKFGASAPNLEWAFYIDSSNRLNLSLRDSAGDFNGVYNSYDLSAHSDTWVHVACTYGGSGPNSSSPFASAHNEINLLVNGEALTSNIQNNSGTYNGMSNSSQAVWIGRRSSSDYFEGEVRNCKIFNKELTSTEIAELARGNDLGFSEEWGGALGGVYTQDATPSGEWSASGGTDADEAGPIGGVANVLKLTINSSTGTHFLQLGGVFTRNKRYRVTGRFYIPSSNSNVDGLYLLNEGSVPIQQFVSPSLDTWVSIDAETVMTAGAAMQAFVMDGGSITVTDAGGDDVIYLADIKITAVGNLASFSAERYDTSTSKLYDISDNAFVGTGTSVTLTGREVPVYETGTWTPSITFGGAAVGVAYTYREGVYTRVGDEVTCHGIISLSNKGSSSGDFLVEGLPFAAAGGTYASYNSGSIGYAANMGGGGMTAQPTFFATPSSSLSFFKFGGSTVTNTDIANNTALRFSITYQIQ